MRCSEWVFDVLFDRCGSEARDTYISLMRKTDHMTAHIYLAEFVPANGRPEERHGAFAVFLGLMGKASNAVASDLLHQPLLDIRQAKQHNSQSTDHDYRIFRIK